MRKPDDKTVALIDPLWIGHHPMYFSQFTASFLRCGARVIGLCPEPDAALADLEQSVDGEISANLGKLVHFHKLPTGKRSFFGGRFEGDPARTFSRWKKAADTLHAAEAASGMRADLVYFPYLDSYLRFLPFPIVPDAILQRPWSGLYLRNHHHGEPSSPMKFLRLLAKGDAILRSDHCRGIGVLDERFIPEIELLTRKTITAYPDVTQGGISSEPFPLAEEIKRKAAGRKIIGIIGLERRKGFLTLIRTAALARNRGLPYYFVCAGAIHPGEYPQDERAEIDATARGIASGEIQNLHFDPQAGRIPSEADFNLLFSGFDIAWAAYEGFQGSSGTLSKAAVFEIPCLATAGECIGQRVERYRMGLTIPEATPEHALAAIPRLIAGTDRENDPLAPRFAAYREDHSQARLDRILADLLASVDRPRHPQDAIR
jgi:glycosyltransferase involved in cell wall biosynthesis